MRDRSRCRPCRLLDDTRRCSTSRSTTSDSPRLAASDRAPARRSTLRASGSIRPYLLAALLDSERGARRPPGARRRRRRRRRPRPRPRARRLPGAAPGPLLPVARHRLRVPPRAAAAPRRPADRRPRRARPPRRSTGDEPPVVVASAVALAEAVPDASLRPTGFVLHRGEEIDLGDVAELLVEAGYERTDQVEERGQFAVRGGILDVFPATEERAARLELFGDEIESIRWFSTFTQRSLGEAERIELDPAAELALEHRELAEIATPSEDGERPDIAELLPVDSLPRPARPDRRRDRGRARRRRGDPGRRCTTTGRT